MARKREKEQAKRGKRSIPDDFESVARRLGADEDKARFEEQLGKIARARQPSH